MQDLSLQLEKRTPKNYQIPPKNYPTDSFPPKLLFGSYPLSHYQKCRKLAPSKNTNEYSLFKSNVYEKFKLQKRFSRSTG